MEPIIMGMGSSPFYFIASMPNEFKNVKKKVL